MDGLVASSRESLLALPRETEPTRSGWGGERVTSDVNKDGGGLSCMERGGGECETRRVTSAPCYSVILDRESHAVELNTRVSFLGCCSVIGKEMWVEFEKKNFSVAVMLREFYRE